MEIKYTTLDSIVNINFHQMWMLKKSSPKYLWVGTKRQPLTLLVVSAI